MKEFLYPRNPILCKRNDCDSVVIFKICIMFSSQMNLNYSWYKWVVKIHICLKDYSPTFLVTSLEGSFLNAHLNYQPKSILSDQGEKGKKISFAAAIVNMIFHFTSLQKLNQVLPQFPSLVLQKQAVFPARYA